ncbi:hypothetical protein MASR1M60_14140 [Rhodocyclaceae bacterium]
MTISTAISNGLAGVQTGMNRVAIAGSRIAMNVTDTSALATNVVEQMQGQHQVGMSANVIKAADEMLGSIIDVRV